MDIKIQPIKDETLINGTSHFGNMIHTNIIELNKIFDKSCFHTSYGRKVTHDWWGSINGIPFTLYDWKEYKKNKDIKDDEFIDWHIGVRTSNEGKFIEAAINLLLGL